MTSIPVPDLNNLKFSKARAEEFGYLRIANTCLLSVLSIALLVIAGMGWEIYKLNKTVADFKPVYVRINDVGKAEVVYYKDASYQPRSPEIIRALARLPTSMIRPSVKLFCSLICVSSQPAL